MQFTDEHRALDETVTRFIEREINPHVPTWEAAQEFPSHELFKKLGMSLADLDLSVRAGNCLEGGKIRFVCDLVNKTENDLLELRAFGRTSLREVKKKLEDMGLNLGMPLPEGFTPPSAG